MNLLVVGGAGYIGSHMTRHLLDQGHQVTVLDDLSTGFADAVDQRAVLALGSVADGAVLNPLLASNRFDAVLHFASRIAAGESVHKPAEYYRVNVSNTVTLLQAMAEHDIRQLIFSSSAGVYGEPVQLPMGEDHRKAPVSPYARSKWLVEQMLPDFAEAYGLAWVALRYFNAAGAHPDGSLTERHDPETHLIPLALQVAAGLRPALTVHGTDYPTADGTCIRDYVHVCDLASAHLAALDYLRRGEPSRAFNLGTGQGHSVRAVIAAVEQVTGRTVPVSYGARRPGDPAELVADANAASVLLRWRPAYPALATMVAHAWAGMTAKATGKAAG
jgi:UDP-glucose 4-epimerase